MPKKKGKGSQGPGLEADDTPLVYDRASVHRTLWGDTEVATHGAHDPKKRKGVAGDTDQVDDTVHAWNAYLGPGGGLQLDAEFKKSLGQRQGHSISVPSGDPCLNTPGTRASIFSTVNEVKKGANRKLSSLAIAAMGGNQRGSVQIFEPTTQSLAAPSGPFFPDTSVDPVLMTTQQPLVSLRQALESRPVERSTSDAHRHRELNAPSKSPKRQVSLSKTALGYTGIATHRPSTLHPPVPQLAPFMTGVVTIDKTQSRRASPAVPILPATTIAAPILPTVAATMEPRSTSRRQVSTGLRGQRLQSRPGDEDDDGSPLTSRIAVKEETQRPQAYKVMRFQSLKEMEADLEHQASSDEDEDELVPAVSVGDVFMPCGNVVFARGVENLNGREVVRVVRLDRASETIIDQLDRKMAISELLPETGRYECILRAKTRIPAHPIAGHDTEALKLMVQESLSGEPPVAMDEAQARKYFGSGKRQAYFKRYKACGLKSYDKPRQSMTYTQVLRAEAVPFGTTTLSDEADEPPDKRAPSSAGAANVETLSSKDKMAAPRAQKEARESGVMASRRVSASVGILSQLEEQKMLPWPLLGHLEEMGSPRLNLRHLGIGPVFSEALAKGFRGLGFLETVDVTNNRIDARSAETLLLALRDHQSLWRLVLDFNRIGPRGASGLVCVLRSSTPLRELSLRANDLGDPIASQVLWALVGHGSMRHVCMAGNRIGNNGSLMVRRMLENGSRLTHLDLGWNNVRGEGAKNLAEGINRNRSLIFLDLSWNGLRGEGLAMLATSLGNHPVLSEVRLERAIWALSEVTALFAALRLRQPKLQVHICDGDMDAASKQDAALLIEAKVLLFKNSSATPPAPPGCQIDPADSADSESGLDAGATANTATTPQSS